MDFRIGGWLIGGRPKCLLIWGDHLFLNYSFFGGQLLLINRGGIINPHLALCWFFRIFLGEGGFQYVGFFFFLLNVRLAMILSHGIWIDLTWKQVGLALLSHFAVAKVYYVILDDIGTILFRIWAPTPKIPREHNDCLFETARFQHCFQSCDTYQCINHWNSLSLRFGWNLAEAESSNCCE
jgi:hypothetical protein